MATLTVVLVREDGAVLQFSLVIPPKLVLSVSASQIWYALKFSVDMREVWTKLRDLMCNADEKLSIVETDGAYANLKLDAHRQELAGRLDPKEFTEMGTCHLHGNKLVEAAMV